MSNSGNVHFTGGSQPQQDLIGQAHATAVSMAQQAQQAASKGGTPFTIWFGNSSNDTVSTRFGEIANTLNTTQFSYDLTQMLSYEIDAGLVFNLNASTLGNSGNQLTIFPWKGLFLQSSQQAISHQASLSIIHLVASARENWNDLATIRDRDGAKFIAQWDPENAVMSPRNYMYFADAIAFKNVVITSGKVLDGTDLKSGDNVLLWTKHGGDNQKWQFEDAGNGYYFITTTNGLALDGTGQGEGDNVLLWIKHGGDNQKWRLEDAGGGYYFIAITSGKVLDGTGQKEGDNVLLWSKHGGDNQKWKIEDA